MQSKDVLFEVFFKSQYIKSISLSTFELIPCRKEIFCISYLIK